MSYLECEKCKGTYELQEGESPEDFESCQCGGKLKHKIDNDFEEDKSEKQTKWAKKVSLLIVGALILNTIIGAHILFIPYLILIIVIYSKQSLNLIYKVGIVCCVIFGVMSLLGILKPILLISGVFNFLFWVAVSLTTKKLKD